MIVFEITRVSVLVSGVSLFRLFVRRVEESKAKCPVFLNFQKQTKDPEHTDQ